MIWSAIVDKDDDDKEEDKEEEKYSRANLITLEQMDLFAAWSIQ